MSDAPAPKLITELQVSAHLMLLDAGIYCVHHTPGSLPPDPQTGLPGARLSVLPCSSGEGVAITGFQQDGWLGPLDSAALIRVSHGPAHVLMTIYQAKDSNHEPPRLQVTRLLEAAPAPPVAAAPEPEPEPEPPSEPPAAEPPQPPAGEAEIAAHVQLRGDVLARIGDWVGEQGSGRWLEGFAISPRRSELSPADIEYQAVLGRGWLSPWAEGGQYCGSRGMALPILGLRVRLRGPAALTHTVALSATFTDGAAIGPVGPGEACEAESLAPLEAFQVNLVPLRNTAPVSPPARTRRAPAPAPAPPPPPAAKPKQAAKPTAKPVARPVAKLAVKRAAPPLPVAKAAARPTGKPAAKPPTKPAPRGRGR